MHLATHSCPLCGNDTPKGRRYCTDCDSAGSYATEDTGATGRTAPPSRRGSHLPLVLLFFVVSAFGTVMTGMFAPSALSLPLLGDVTARGSLRWGELRVARVASNIRASASTSSGVVGKLSVGDTVRVEAVPGGWFRVFGADPIARLEAEPLGYVFGDLLVEPPEAGS